MLSSGCTWDLMIFNSGPNFSLQAITRSPLGHCWKEFSNKLQNSDELTCSRVKINYLTWQLNYTFLFAALQHAKHQPKHKHKVLVCQPLEQIDPVFHGHANLPEAQWKCFAYIHKIRISFPAMFINCCTMKSYKFDIVWSKHSCGCCPGLIQVKNLVPDQFCQGSAT